MPFGIVYIGGIHKSLSLFLIQRLISWPFSSIIDTLLMTLFYYFVAPITDVAVISLICRVETVPWMIVPTI